MRLFPFLFVILLLFLIPNVKAFRFELQVGAWGDAGSKGNRGVAVEIQTHIYNTNQGDLQYFWVGDNLENGAFIQFGYIYEPGYWCLKGSTNMACGTGSGDSAHVGGSDARWEWQYWPDRNGKDFSFQKGPANSAGLDGSWHKYTIQPNAAGEWSFLLDGREVSHLNERWARSDNAAYFVAEKGSDVATFSRLGPVEFRDLAYLKDDGWYPVTALYAIVGCGEGTDCNVKNPYGVMREESGVVIAGGGIHQPKAMNILLGTLTVDLPPQVNGLLDRKISVAGSMQVPLSPGLHTVTVPATVALDGKSRLRFDHWSDESKSPNRTITLQSETTLKATYVTQYLLVADSVVPLDISGWYDRGSTVLLSAKTSPIHAELGILGGQWIFDGWYKDGAFLTGSPTASIPLDAPHSLQARWHPDYSPSIATAILLFPIALFLVYWRCRRKRQQQTVGTKILGVDANNFQGTIIHTLTEQSPMPAQVLCFG